MVWKRTLTFLILLFIAFISFIQEIEGNQTKIDSLSLSEKSVITQFFKEVIREDHYGFTLFHEKPVSLAGYFVKCPSLEIPNAYRNRKIKEGWALLKKKPTLLNEKAFIFCEEFDTVEDLERGCQLKTCAIYLINLKNLSKTLNENCSLFSNKLGKDFDPETFVNKVNQTKQLTPHLKYDEELLGILLGYGREASRSFFENSAHLAPPPSSSFVPLESQKLKKNTIRPVVFMGDPLSEENFEILHTYSSQTESIEAIYKDPKFLSIILRKLQEG